MSQAPSPTITPEPLVGEVNLDLSGFLTGARLHRQVEEDRLSLGLYRMQERSRRLRGISDPTQAAAIADTTELLGDDFLLQSYSSAFRQMKAAERPERTRGEMAVERIQMEQAAKDELDPTLAFVNNFLSAVARTGQELGVSAWQLAGTITQLGLNPLVRRNVAARGERMNEIAEDYRARILSGESDDLGELLQRINVRAQGDTWGHSFGRLAAQVIPSLAPMMGGAGNARRAMNGVMWLYAGHSAGMGIEKYRHEQISQGRPPDATTAMLVGLGYGAAEYLTEKIDVAVPWSEISTGVAARIGEAVLRREPGKIARYVTNSAGYVVIEGFEEQLAGDAQELIDFSLIDGRYDRTGADRLRDFGWGAAGSVIAMSAGAASPAFRELMTQEPTFLSRSGIDRAMTERAMAQAMSQHGSARAVAQGMRTVTPPVAGPEEVAPGAAPAAPVEINVEEAMVEYRRALGEVGVGVEPRQLAPEELSRAQTKMIESWEKRGITVIPIAPDQANPLPAFTSSQRGVVIVEMTPNAKVNDVLAEMGLIAHEAAHVLKAERPDVHELFVETVPGPLMAAARTYADAATQAGVELGLDNPDRLIDEGGALLFQAMIERAGLASELAQGELGLVRGVTDFIRRTASKYGLRGITTQAVLDTIKGVQRTEGFRPVQPPEDILEGVKPPRFAVRPTGEPDPRSVLLNFGRQLSREIVTLDNELAAMRNDLAEFVGLYDTAREPLSVAIRQAETQGELRSALSKAFVTVMKRQVGAITQSLTDKAKEQIERTTARFENRIAKTRERTVARETQLQEKFEKKVAKATLKGEMVESELRQDFAQEIETLRAKAEIAQKAARTRLEERIEEITTRAASRESRSKKEFEHRLAMLEEYWRWRTDQLKDLHQRADTTIKSILPIEERGRFVGSVTKIRNDQDLQRLIGRVYERLDQIEHAKARASADATLEKARTATLTPEQHDEINRIIGTYGPLDTLDAGQLNMLAAEVDGAFKLLKAQQAAEKKRKYLEQVATNRAVAAESAAVARTDRAGGPIERRRLRQIGDVELNKKRWSRLPANMVANGGMKPDMMGMWAFGENGVGHTKLNHEIDREGDRRFGITHADEDYADQALHDAGYEKGSDVLAATSRNLAQMRKMKPVTTGIPLESGETLEVTELEHVDLLGMMMHPGTLALMQPNAAGEPGAPIKNRVTGEQYVLTHNDILAIRRHATWRTYLIAQRFFERFNGSMAASFRDWSVENRGWDMTEANHWPRSRELDDTPDVADWTEKNLQRAGLLMEKTHDRTKPIYVDDALKKYLNHSWRLASIVTLERPIREARAIIASTEVRESLQLSRAADVIGYYKEWLDQLSAEGLGAPPFRKDETGLTRAVQVLGRNVAASVLAGNLKVLAMQQPFGLLNAAAADLGILPLLHAAIGRGAMFRKSLDPIIRQHPWLRHRMDATGFGLVTESEIAVREVAGIKPKGWGAYLNWVMGLYGKLDHTITRAVFAAYRSRVQRANPDLSQDEINMQALAVTARNIKKSQATFDLIHMSGFARAARSGNALALAMNTFMSQLSASGNLIAQDVLRAKRNPTPQNVAVATRTMFAVGVVAGGMGIQVLNDIFSTFIKLGGGEGEDERRAWVRYLDAATSGFLAMSPFTNWTTGLVARHLFGRKVPLEANFSVVGNMVADVAESGIYLAGDVFRRLSNLAFDSGYEIKDDQMGRAVERLITNLAPLSGVPGVPHYRLAKRALYRKKGGGGGALITSGGRSRSRSVGRRTSRGRP